MVGGYRRLKSKLIYGIIPCGRRGIVRDFSFNRLGFCNVIGVCAILYFGLLLEEVIFYQSCPWLIEVLQSLSLFRILQSLCRP